VQAVEWTPLQRKRDRKGANGIYAVFSMRWGGGEGRAGRCRAFDFVNTALKFSSLKTKIWA